MSTQFDTRFGVLGDRTGANVARVEVSVYSEQHDTTEYGHYIVYATGDEAEAQEEGTIYAVFEGLVHERMTERMENGWYTSYEIEDISSV